MGLTVITGGGGDFGRAVGMKFGESGPVLLTNRSVNKMEETLSIMQGLGMECRAVHLDVSERDSCFECAEQARTYAEELGTEITSVINIAGISGNYFPGLITEDQIKINAIGTVNVTDAFYDKITSGGVQINFASMAAYRVPMFDDAFVEVYKSCGEPGFDDRMMGLVNVLSPYFPNDYAAAYCISKNFVIWYTYANVKKFAAKNKRILSISPGTHLTRHIREMPPEVAKAQMALNPLGRWGSPVDMASSCAFLCSESAKYFTGCDIMIDGGSTRAETVFQFE